MKATYMMVPPYQYLPKVTFGKITKLSVPDSTYRADPEKVVGETRRLSEVLYYIFMRRYILRLEAYWKCSNSNRTA